MARSGDMAAAASGLIRTALLPAALLFGTAAQAEVLERRTALDFLVQSVCLDEAGRPLPGVLPFEPGCARRRPARQGEPLPWRKTDWPAPIHAAAQPEGYMASDAMLGEVMGQEAAIQTFDHGGGNYAFSRFDPRADGGQVAVLGQGGADLAVTQDGGRPGQLQWFLSPGCRSGAPLAAGWLIFGAEVPSGHWAESVARLRIAPAANACPEAFDSALTRWRRETMPIPIRFHDEATPREVPMDVIVSEHFGGATIPEAGHLERFWYARGLGMVRWERWEDPARNPRVAERAAWFTETQRCLQVPFSDRPAPGWAMVDCRTWTNFRRARAGEALRSIPWPPG
ncbi:hypothetical protein [Roseomonas xinghualingensis]|uniref:hypothetical protein n=1 Tax=Roseomonas xinghualingensis TaxID=2986475 RepID=UPI0021F125A7|nr:hypothetical protein [Roseomonas sp. SXEYE001]MCV4207636.1 hypothetical protein [Roseomonas sp. SXEYE001]